MKRVYIAGPMRGYRLFNFPAFDAAAARLAAKGWEIVSPADLDRESGFDPSTLPADYDWNNLGSFNLSAAIDRDLLALKACTAIYMLDGWQKSKGAKAEKALAEWIGLEVIFEVQPEEDVLEEALRITKGDRNAQYGPPDQDFARTAAMWSALKGIKFESWEVAQFMILLKLSRLQHQIKRDSVVDIAGYARCMAVCYTESEYDF